ncbi:MAG: hypothetical protein KKE20_02835 [Nanoarchaeota archaeon]|nr:hypothetical protein [Nanoarchaeota archaeon]
MQNQKLSRLGFTLLWLLLAIGNALILQGLVIYFSALKQFHIITTYILIIILSVGAGLLASMIIHRFTQDDKQIAIASIVAILPAAFLTTVILRTIRALSNQLNVIAADSGTPLGIGMVSLFNSYTPHHVFVPMIMFICFCGIFIVEFSKKKDFKALISYGAALILLFILVFIYGTVISDSFLFDLFKLRGV